MKDKSIDEELSISTLEQVANNVDKFIIANKRKKTQYEIQQEEHRKKKKVGERI